MLPRPDTRGPIGDRSIGPLVARKLGRRVVDTLVDPLVGGIHAGSVDDMSAAATFPPLLAAAQRRGGLMRALRAEVPPPDPEGPPLFWALAGSMSTLVDTLVAGLRGRGVAVRLSAPADALARHSDGWTVASAGQQIAADAVILATPAGATAALLRPHDDEVAGLLDAIDYASVVLVTFRLGTDQLASALDGTGFLVPRHSSHKGREPWAVTACTFLDRKWPHLEREGEVLLRASLGRIDDTRASSWSDDEVAERGPGKSWARSWAWAANPMTRWSCAIPARSRSTGSTTCCERPASSRPWRGSVVSPSPVRPTTASASRPASPAGGRRHARSCDRGLPRRGRVAVPSVAAGVLLALSLPPWGWWPLGLVGAALLYWRLAGLSLRARILSGWLAGLGCDVIGLAWARSFNWYGAVVLVLVEALSFAAAAGRHAAAPRAGAGLRGRVHPGRSHSHVVALRRAAARAACSSGRPAARWSSWPDWVGPCSSPPASGPAASPSPRSVPPCGHGATTHAGRRSSVPLPSRRASSG